jgi:hypothetical protein
MCYRMMQFRMHPASVPVIAALHARQLSTPTAEGANYLYMEIIQNMHFSSLYDMCGCIRMCGCLGNIRKLRKAFELLYGRKRWSSTVGGTPGRTSTSTI